MVVKLFLISGNLCSKFGILNEGNVGNEGKLEKFGISILEIPKFLICGIEKPSKLSKPVNGDCKASLGLSSDDELEPSDEDEGDDEDDMGDESGDDVRSLLLLIGNILFLSKFELIC